MECMRIWVYGSLLEGFFNYRKVLVGKVLSRKAGQVKGKIFHQLAKGYPALLAGDDWVEGELLEIEDFHDTLEMLDVLENYFGPGDADNEYERIVTPVFLPGTDAWTEAYVYWYGRDDLGSPENPVIPLPDGSWRTFMRKNNT
ncbi:gamma-glutamylcyclotransferase family protein [Parasphaerochaeta coccoides]|uniref:AIG2 family protein n=1 Tax=Parasphaerochaeta coccoides (strain ATCC BAA-1237 / DSM 17374 / SPN1) TaxID=760011 RepID=F4GIH9_PARC1|nr:gamma-glutamylcyclotransferase family protein [Parasphaerochaeta coccoides]AEC01687.1 AIG2 family protein [Parasphaerochaeta coccoides DSM 17374]